MNPIYNTGEKAKKAIKKEVAKFFKKEKMPRFRIYLAEEKGKIVAFLTCGISKPFDEGWDRRKKIGFLGAAYVLPRHRRKGIMRDLYKEFELWLEKKKIKYVELDVLSNNKEGFSAWDRLGFENYEYHMRKKILILSFHL